MHEDSSDFSAAQGTSYQKEGAASAHQATAAELLGMDLSRGKAAPAWRPLENLRFPVVSDGFSY